MCLVLVTVVVLDGWRSSGCGYRGGQDGGLGNSEELARKRTGNVDADAFTDHIVSKRYRVSNRVISIKLTEPPQKLQACSRLYRVHSTNSQDALSLP